MRCAICKRASEEVELFEGIYGVDMVNICDLCAEKEDIPIIKKPSEAQLEKADERFSVRERMERLSSGPRKTTKISNEQMIVQGNLARLKMPEKKQFHEDVVEDYYWVLNISRRRLKMSISQLAEKIGVEAEVIKSIEQGKIPEKFEEIFLKLEAYLGIKLLKKLGPNIKFVRNYDEEKEILERVQRRIDGVDDDDFDEEKSEKIEQISKGEANFSKRGDLQDVTLNDLITMKREREKKSAQRKKKIQTEAMVGEDIDLEIEED